MDINIDYSGNTLDKYYLVEKLGNGSFGAVYRAHDRILGVDKAIKIMEVTSPKEAYNLFNEAAIPYKCRHNHIIKINSGELIKVGNEIVFIIDMDLANGKSLDNILKDKFISVADGLNIIKNILFAVEYSHIQKIIHRDIKPANILLDNGVPKLSDFGLATVLGNMIIPWRWYRTHAAPETFDNDSIATVETDIYALGMTLYRIVNNISDWKQLLATIPNAEKHIKSGKLIDKLPKAPFVPQKVSKIIKKACRISPKDRYHSAKDMRNAIEKLPILYNWNLIEENHWKGMANERPTKEIYLEPKRNSVDVIITNNGRKNLKECKKFNDIFDAEQYLFDYIRETTLQ